MAGNYLFTSILGEGSSGIVYRAWDLDNERDVALKLLHERLAADAEVVARFLAEADTLRQLDHPHIVPVLDSGTIVPPAGGDPLPYLALPYFPAGNLRDYLNSYHAQQKRLPRQQAVELVLQLAEGLAYAHEQGVVHFDVKPENVLLRREAEGERPFTAVLTDFGLAQRLQTVTRLRIGSGSFPYMAPERLRREASDGRADIYALTVLLYLLWEGKLPYPIDSFADALEHVETAVPTAGLPPLLKAIVREGMAKEPSKRYGNIAALAAALRAVLATPLDEPTPEAVAAEPEIIKLVKTDDLQSKVIAPIEVGNRLDIQQTWEATSEYRLLIAHQYKRERIRYLDKGYIRIGRHPDNDICLDDKFVSAHHAILERTPGRKWQVLDLQSDNKTYLNGTPLLDFETPTVWDSDQTLQIGSYFFQWQDVAHLQQKQNGAARPPTPPLDPDEVPIELDLSDEALTLTAGQTADLVITVKNLGKVTRHYHVGLEGEEMPIRWQNPVEPLKLLAGESGEKAIRLTALPGSTAVAGAYGSKVVVRFGDGSVVRSQPLLLTIPPVAQLVADMHPSHIRHGDSTRVLLENQGNSPQTYLIEARDEAAQLLFEPVSQRTVTVPNGQSLGEPFTVKSKKRWWQRLWPKTAVVPFVVTVRPETNTTPAPPPQTKNGQLEVPPLIPPVLFIILLLLIAGLIVGFNWLQAQNAALNTQLQQEQQDKAAINEELAAISERLEDRENLSAQDVAALEQRQRELENDNREREDTISSLEEQIESNQQLLQQAPPQFEQTELPDAREDESYSTTIAATDPDGHAVTIEAQNLPSWLNVDSLGNGRAALSGNPTNDEVGEYRISLRAIDNDDEDVQVESFTLTVLNSNDPPEFNSEPVTTATEDVLYSYNITATDIDIRNTGGEGLSFSLVTAPPWLRNGLEDNGDGTALLEGIPQDADGGQTQNVVIEVSDSSEAKTLQEFTIVVKNTNDPPEFEEDELKITAAEDEDPAKTTRVKAKDRDKNDKLTFSLPVSLAWLTLTDEGDGEAVLSILKPTDADVGTHEISLQVQDSAGAVDTLPITIEITPVPDPPVIDIQDCLNKPNAYDGFEYSCTVRAIDPDDTPVTFPSSQSLPSWLVLSNTGVLSGTPDDDDINASPYMFEIKVQDDDPSEIFESGTLTITVHNTEDPPVLRIESGCSDKVDENSDYPCTVAADDDDLDEEFEFSVSGAAWLNEPTTRSGNTSGSFTFSGNPGDGDVGNFDLVVTVEDSSGLQASMTIQVEVENTPDAPRFHQIADEIDYDPSIDETPFLAPNGIITDPDSFATKPVFSFKNGSLEIEITEGYRDGDDQLQIIEHDEIVNIKNDNEIFFEDNKIGTFTLENELLTINFDGDAANEAAATAVLQRIQLSYNNTDSPCHTSRTIKLTMYDGSDGAFDITKNGAEETITLAPKKAAKNTQPSLNGNPDNISNSISVSQMLKLDDSDAGKHVYQDENDCKPGIAITQTAGKDGRDNEWQYCIEKNCTENDWKSINDGDLGDNDLHLDASAFIRFKGTPLGNACFKFRAWDQSNSDDVANGGTRAIVSSDFDDATDPYSSSTTIANLNRNSGVCPLVGG